MDDLRAVLLAQIEEYERELDRLAREEPPATGPPRGAPREWHHRLVALSALRRRHPEFHDYVAWVNYVANDRGDGWHTAVAITPDPQRLRSDLDRYLAARAAGWVNRCHREPPPPRPAPPDRG